VAGAVATPGRGVSAGSGPLAFAALVCVLVLSPLPMGSVGLLPASFWAALIGLAAGMQAVAMLVRPPAGRLSRRPLQAPLAAFVLVAAWILMQSAGWGPAAWHHPLWDEVAWLDAPAAAAISLDRFATRTALMNLLACAGVFWLTLSSCRTYERKWLLFRCLVAIQCAYALWGLIHFFGRLDAGLSVPGGLPAPPLGRLRSTFFNANSYAAFATMGVLLCAAQLMRIVQRGIRHAHGVQPLLRSGLQTLFGPGGPWLFAFCLTSAAALLTGSRGGLLALVAGIGVLALLSSGHRQTRAAAIGALLVLGAGATWLSGAQTLQRMEHEVRSAQPILEDRLAVWDETMDLIGVRPWLGTGYGTFGQAFQAVRPPTLAATFERAHNDYLETALELGLPAAALWLLTLGALVFLVARIRRRGSRNHIYVQVALAAATAIGVHSLVDFPLQLPANAYLLACLLALPFATDRDAYHRGRLLPTGRAEGA
jgi:O-antigen ligase